MAYSQKSFQSARRGAYAMLFAGVAVLIFLEKRHYIDQTLYMSLACVLALGASWLLLYSHRYRDEIQRHAAEKRTYWGCQIGLLASIPVLVALMMPHTTWLDGLVQFVSRNHAMPRIYFWAGFMLPVLFQALGVFLLRLLAKLRSGEQA
ncbi:MAG TPA: hypothetical protein VN175_09630 [Rhizomicrobium sp.]|nr:hypothetical protein [Rhizomicrobium sp.]